METRACRSEVEVIANSCKQEKGQSTRRTGSKAGWCSRGPRALDAEWANDLKSVFQREMSWRIIWMLELTYGQPVRGPMDVQANVQANQYWQRKEVRWAVTVGTQASEVRSKTADGVLLRHGASGNPDVEVLEGCLPKSGLVTGAGAPLPLYIPTQHHVLS